MRKNILWVLLGVVALLVVCVIAGAVGIFFYVIYYTSNRGKIIRDYNSDLEEWQSNDLAKKFSSYSFSYKVLPVMDKLRDREMFMLEYRDKANPKDVELSSS